ncbi:MAG TPA: SDR family oxidoreductase [Gemmatimonadaceae bacterium]|nr:SDR family oxidoreductase [Gemmatimonadaceae bacterium]
MRQRSVVVTGVSTGIGAAVARTLAARDVHVFGSVRKTGDAAALAAELGDRFTPLVFDVRDDDGVRAGAQTVREQLAGRTLFGLVNNAGIALGGPLACQPLDEIRLMLEVNVVGALRVTQALLPLLGAERGARGAPGRIVNISSVAGRIGGPFLGGYVASKHALEGMSESLRRELLLHGIDVIVVAPGSVATPIWDKAEGADVARYDATPYAAALRAFREEFIRNGRRGYPPERVAAAVWTALSARRPRTRYAVVPGRLMNWTIPMALPARLVDRLLAARFGLRRA